MFCMKCGRETVDEQVFCESCLQTMAQYPVKPGTAIHLPHREQKKKTVSRKRKPSAEEQVQKLKVTVKRLIAVVAILAVALCLATIALIHVLLDGQSVPTTGKNYTIDTSQAP